MQHANARKLVVSASTTALLTLALFAVVLWHCFGGVAYSHLAWMAALMAGYILTFTGEAHHLIVNQTLAAWGMPLQRSFAMLAVAYSHFFIISFLELKRRRPLARRIFLSMALAQILIAAVSWLEGTQPSAIGGRISNVLILVSIPLVLWQAWLAYRDHLQAGRYVLFAWGPALFVLGVWIIALQGWLPPEWLDVGDWVFCSMAFQVAILLLGLADDTARLRRERDVATSEAGHDPLTGALNRRALRQRLGALLGGPSPAPLSLVFLDLDHFKRVNDRFGHAVGDRCLCELVERTRQAMGEGDLLARFGGEEFVVVLPGRDGHAAAVWADDLRERIAAQAFSAGPVAFPVNASLGVCEWTPGDSIDTLIEHADQALYSAKQGGRNRVNRWSPSQTAELA